MKKNICDLSMRDYHRMLKEEANKILEEYIKENDKQTYYNYEWGHYCFDLAHQMPQKDGSVAVTGWNDYYRVDYMKSGGSPVIVLITQGYIQLVDLLENDEIRRSQPFVKFKKDRGYKSIDEEYYLNKYLGVDKQK